MRILKVIAFSLTSFAPSISIAETFENYFTVDGYRCGNYSYIAEWSVTGDAGDGITIARFVRREDRAQPSFEGLSWQFSAADLSAGVTVNDANDRTLYAFENMLSDNPEITVLDRRGEPRDDCAVTLKASPNPVARFGATIAALSVAAPNASDGRQVNRLIARLPPAAMLPTLAQASTQRDVQNGIAPFWDRYEATVLARAENVEDTSLLRETSQLWTEQDTNQTDRFHGSLLLRAQDIRAASRRQQDADVTQIATLNMDALCARIDGFITHWNWDQYLELATGLPLEYWNDTLAERFLDLSQRCENADRFQNVISRRWPDVQARIAAFQEVMVERDRIANLDITLASIAAENWLSLDSGRLSEWRGAGLSRDDVLAVLSPALEMQRQKATVQLPVALGDLARAETIELAAFSSWCNRKRQEIGYAYNNTLQEAVFEACNEELAALLREQALTTINARKTALMNAPEDIATLIATDGYSFEDAIPRLRWNTPAFEQAIADINTAVAAARNATEVKYQTVLKSGMDSITTAFTNADPMGESAEAALEVCVPFNGFGTPQRLRPISDLCKSLGRDLQDRKQKAECDLTWSNMDISEDVQSGYINARQLLGGAQPVSIRAVVCESMQDGVNVWIAEDSGWFSSEIRLYREARLHAEDVEISVRLRKLETGASTWIADDLRLSSGTSQIDEDATSADIMGCFYYPEVCYAP